MSYTVLARKWRPKRFAEVVGQQHVVQALVNSLAAERLHHAYLFADTRCVGKTTVAVNLAYAFAAMGKSVGIMDADLHGPNVALMTGIEGLKVHGENGVMSPIVAAKSVKVLSIASFLPGADQPVVWRGPRRAPSATMPAVPGQLRPARLS